MESQLGDFTKLAVGRETRAVVLDIYQETASWPKHEVFGLVSQSRRGGPSREHRGRLW
jgi:hypothetical protein